MQRRLKRLLRARGTPSEGEGGGGDVLTGFAVTSDTSGAHATADTHPSAVSYILEVSNDPLTGFAEFDTSGTPSFDDTAVGSGIPQFYRMRWTDGLSTSDATSVRVGGKQGSGSAITLGTLTLTPSFESIGIELAHSGDSDKTAKAYAEYSADSGATWRHAVDKLRNVGDAFYGSILLCTAGTGYTVRVTVVDPGGVSGATYVEGTTTTRSENILSHAALLATATKYVDAAAASGGNGSLATPWQTLDAAISGATTGDVIHVDSSGGKFYPRSTSSISGKALTFVTEYPSATGTATSGTTNGTGAEANAGNRAIVFDTMSGPTGASETLTSASPPGPLKAKGPWTAETPDGNGAHIVYKWTGAGHGAGTVNQMNTCATIAGTLSRMANWKASGTGLTSASAFATTIYTNQTFNYGFWQDGATNDLYARFPGDVNPNTLYVYLGTHDAYGFDIASANCRVSGFEFRSMAGGCNVGQNADDFVLDSFIASGCYNGGGYVQGSSTPDPDDYPLRVVIQDFVIRDSNVYNRSGFDASNTIPWNLVKGEFTTSGGTTNGTNRIAEMNETAAISFKGGSWGLVVRRGLVDGPFNGFANYSPGFDRYTTANSDFYDLTVKNLADDCFEPEGNAINWRIWNVQAEHALVFISAAPLNYGPVYVFRVTAWQLGRIGTSDWPRANNSNDPAAYIIKAGGGATVPAIIYLLNSTFWTNSYSGDTSDSTNGYETQGAEASGPDLYLRNTIVRMTRHTFKVPSGKLTGFDENANLWTTDDSTGRGIQYSGTYTTNVAGYRSAYLTNFGRATTTNIGDTAFTAEAAVDGILTNTTTGDLTLLAGTNIAVDAGVPLPNVAETYNGTAPDLGRWERS